MQIIVLADKACQEEFNRKKISSETQVNFIENISEISNHSDADAIFLLKENPGEDYTILPSKPVFINSVADTLKELNLPENFIRVNGWPGFLSADLWEVATTNENMVREVFNKLKWNYIRVADEP